MQYGPTRRALAGSVLVLGSVSTVSAVHLDSASVPSSPDGQSASAMSPTVSPGGAAGGAAGEGPGSRPSVPDTASPASVGAVRPGTQARSARSSSRRSTHTADRPVTGRDLIDMAHGPRGAGSVTVPAHDVERTAPLRATPRSGRSHVLGGGLRSFDDLLEFGEGGSGDYGRYTADSWSSAWSTGRAARAAGGNRYLDRTDSSRGSSRIGFDDTDFQRADFGWDDDGDRLAGRSGAGYHHADVRWDPSDVSYARSRCGRHRA